VGDGHGIAGYRRAREGLLATGAKTKRSCLTSRGSFLPAGKNS
jgi:hypothetical protein